MMSQEAPEQPKSNHPRDHPILVALIGAAAVIAAAVITVIFTHSASGGGGPQRSPSGPTQVGRSAAPTSQTSRLPIPVTPAFRLYDPGSTGVYGVAFNRGGTLAAGDLNGSVYLWDVAKAKLIGTFPDSNHEAIFGVALNPAGTILAADTLNVHGYTKGSVVLWNTSSGKLIATLNVPGGGGFGNPPAFSPDGSILAVGDENANTYIWNMNWQNS